MNIFNNKEFLYNKYLLVILLLISSYSSYSQTLTKGQKPDHIFAKYCIKFHNYYDGLHEYEALLKLHPDNDLYRWGVGYCHLHLNKDKSKAIPYFIEILSKENADQSIWYDLGHAYLVTNMLDSAEIAFRKYTYSLKNYDDDKHDVSAKRMMEMIENARIAMDKPINVSITNAGKYINTEFPEFNPYVNSNEKLMVYSSQNMRNSGRFRHEDGYYASDIYYSYFKFGKWKKKKRFSSIINTSGIEIDNYLSYNAAHMVVYRVDLLDKKKQYFIYTKRGKSYGNPKEILIDGIDMFYVKSLMISPDNKWLIISSPSTRKGAKDLDLFYSKRSPEGFWMPPIAFDSTVNSNYDDAHPYFEPQSKKLFFASKGHNSIGGYDIFECDLSFENDSIQVSNTKNIGYPVNTTMDNTTISFNHSGRYAYISALRADGFGDLDIYRVVFENKQPLYSYIHGNIFDKDSTDILSYIERVNNHIDTLNFPINHEFKRILKETKDSVKAYQYLSKNKIPYEKLDMSITAYDEKTNKKVGEFIAQEKTGRYVIILPPGDYKLVFSRKGFEDRYEHIKIQDFDTRNQDIEMQIVMRQK